MPSLDAKQDRHVVIDRRAGHYLCFPDVCLADDGTLLCVYNEFDRHVGTRRRLLLKTSADGGLSWSGPRMLRADDSHCPRLRKLADGQLVLVDDAGARSLWSADHGKSWTSHFLAGVTHGLLDRPLELDGQTLVLAGHLHRGTQPRHVIRQAPTEQMLYVSPNLGGNWEQLSVIAAERCLVLCEASLVRLPGVGPGGAPRLLALMRENSFVGEPMYCALSEDGGVNWSAPEPTPLIGHRPTLDWTRSGRLLVTYRDVGANPGTRAWLGDVDELRSDFAVHGLHPQPGNPALTPDGLLVRSPSGPAAPVRYFLRPMTDPEHARADFEAEVQVRAAEENGCGLRLGIWWKLSPGGVRPDLDGAEEIAWEPGRFHTLRVVYEPGLCRLFVDGSACGEYPVDRLDGDTRPILAGAVARKSANACEALWRRMALTIDEPRLGRAYAWRWEHTQGLPDAANLLRTLELKNDRHASLADFGYSGWAETSPGRFFCAYHHGGGDTPGYREGLSAHVQGTWFTEEDFGVPA